MIKSLAFLFALPLSVSAAQVDYAAVKTLPTIVSGALLAPTGDTVRYSGTGRSYELVRMAVAAGVCHRTFCVVWTDNQNYAAFSKTNHITHEQLENYIYFMRGNAARIGIPTGNQSVAAVLGFDLYEKDVDLTQFNVNEAQSAN